MTLSHLNSSSQQGKRHKPAKTLQPDEESFQNLLQLWKTMSTIGTGLEGTFSPIRFSDIEQFLTKNSYETIKELGLEYLTRIQAKTLCSLLSFSSVDLISKTGSGKTLAYVLPIFENLAASKYKHTYGTGAIIIAPTRELCFQIHDVASKFALNHGRSCVLLVSGSGGFGDEQKRLSKGGTIVVATPGRLIQHLTENEDFTFNMLMTLVVDEADRMVKEGFVDQLNQIISIIKDSSEKYKDGSFAFPKQVIAVTATMTEEVKEMLKPLVKPNHKVVDLTNDEGIRTNTTLEQAYFVVKSSERFTVLCNFLRQHSTQKIMVFMNTCKGASYFQNVISSVFAMGDTLAMQGDLEQKDRSKIFFKFCKSKKAILFCTDIAARGLDIKDVDYIVQYDPPFSANEYVHRVGRTARAGNCGNAILFLRPEEISFLEHLKGAGLNMKEDAIDCFLRCNDTEKLKDAVETNSYLSEIAEDAFRKYLRAYNSHPIKQAFDISRLDFNEVAESFGFRVRPDISGLHLSNLRKSHANSVPKRFKFLTPRVTVLPSDESSDEL